MRQRLLTDLRRSGSRLWERVRGVSFRWTIERLYRKYRGSTMVTKSFFADNLRLCHSLRAASGCVVECGVWRGGMAAAMAEVLGPDRQYYLLDSFEGLPPAEPIDGPSALAWQANPEGPLYFGNCAAERGLADEAMQRSGAPCYTLVQGWFKDTLPGFTPDEPILVLRLDADWYSSTMACLTHLYSRVRDGGVVIIDDYLIWEGCARAVHDFLSRQALPDAIRQTARGVTYIKKKAPHL